MEERDRPSFVPERSPNSRLPIGIILLVMLYPGVPLLGAWLGPKVCVGSEFARPAGAAIGSVAASWTLLATMLRARTTWFVPGERGETERRAMIRSRGFCAPIVAALVVGFPTYLVQGHVDKYGLLLIPAALGGFAWAFHEYIEHSIERGRWM